VQKEFQAALEDVKGIVTHGGRIHLDDFLSVALALQYLGREKVESGEIFIERRVPSEKELASSEVLVFDTGMLHEPEKMNFDHHALSVTGASFKLFLEALGVWERFTLAHVWAERAVVMDCLGPRSWAQKVSIPEEVLFQMLSPLEAAVFSSERDSFSSPVMLGLLDLVGKHCISMMTEMDDLLCELEKARHDIVTPNGVHGFVFEGSTRSRTFPAASKCLAERTGCEFCVTPDDRGEGWSLYRFGVSSRLDLKRLEGRSEIQFTHVGGFLAKTRNRSVDLFDLIDSSIAPGSLSEIGGEHGYFRREGGMK
jgi:hypothetical protein